MSATAARLGFFVMAGHALLGAPTLLGCYGPPSTTPAWYVVGASQSGYPGFPRAAARAVPAALPVAAQGEAPALELPSRPGPFGLLGRVKLGQSRAEVAAVSSELGEHSREDRGERSFSVDFRGERVVAMQVVFRDRDPMPELVARWGALGAEGVWAVEEDALQVIPEAGSWAVRFVPYVPMARLLGHAESKLTGLAAEVLAMDRRAFEARFPDTKREERGRRTLFGVTLAPTEGAQHESELEADFDAGGALLALELSVTTRAMAAVDAALRAVYGVPRELTLCPADKKPCEVVSGVYQADPVLRYGMGTAALEVSAWPHDWARLTIRWSRTATRTDMFTTFTPPERVRDAEHTAR